MKYLLTFLTLVPLLAWSASFDCQKARSTTEKMICADAQLSQLDTQLAQTYHAALKTLTKRVKDVNDFLAPEVIPALIQEQKNWITYVRNICQDAACLREAYQARIELLKRDPDPGSDIYPQGSINGQIFDYIRDPSGDIASYNEFIMDDSSRTDYKMGKWIGLDQSKADKNEPGKIIGCNKLVYMPSGGTAPNAYTSGAICTLQQGKKRTLVRICANEIFGNYVIEAIDKPHASYKALADFANSQCGVGG